MSGILTIGRAKVELHERDQAVALYRDAVQSSGLADLAEAITLWESTETPGDYMALHRYARDEDADRAFEIIGTSESLAKVVSLADTPLDIRRYRIAAQKGQQEFEDDLGTILSVSIRQADPGLGWDLDAELARILDEIAFIDGFLGSMHGRSVAVHEEILSIALWSSEEAFRESVPGHHLFTVSAYRRVI